MIILFYTKVDNQDYMLPMSLDNPFETIKNNIKEMKLDLHTFHNLTQKSQDNNQRLMSDFWNMFHHICQQI